MKKELLNEVLQGDPEKLPESSLEEWNHFSKSALWKDIENEIRVWLGQIVAGMDDPETEEKVWRILQGNSQSLKRVLMIPQMFIDRWAEYDETIRKEED